MRRDRRSPGSRRPGSPAPARPLRWGNLLPWPPRGQRRRRLDASGRRVYKAPLFRSVPGRTRKMPKLKTKRSAVKRFRMTGTGKIKAGKANRRHNLSLGKNRKRKNRLANTLILEHRDEKHPKKALPYELPAKVGARPTGAAPTSPAAGLREVPRGGRGEER